MIYHISCFAWELSNQSFPCLWFARNYLECRWPSVHWWDLWG